MLIIKGNKRSHTSLFTYSGLIAQVQMHLKGGGGGGGGVPNPQPGRQGAVLYRASPPQPIWHG